MSKNNTKTNNTNKQSSSEETISETSSTSLPQNNNTTPTRTEISSLGEFGLIDRISSNNETKNASTILSIGDDGAVIDNYGKQTVISTDLLLEGIHFDLAYTPLNCLGYKSVVVNASDIFAMNADPSHITVSLGVSNRFSVEAIDHYYEGVYQACDKYGIDLVGGDISASKQGMVISITAVGEVTPGKFVTRSGAGDKELICVSGDLGAAFLGLTLLERERKIFLETGIQPYFEGQSYIIKRFLMPDARKDIIEFFQEKNLTPTAMIDVSDGLSSDLLHICKMSEVGCVIYEDKIPIAEDTRQFAYKLNLDPTACALSGGEDYELLFTIKQSDYDIIKENTDISVIGYITPKEEGTNIITRNGNKHVLTAQGWVHHHNN